MNPHVYNRRQFLWRVGAGLAAALAFVGCEETDLDNPRNSTAPSEDSSTETPTPTTDATNTPPPSITPTYRDVRGTISNNHGHTVTISANELAAGRGTTLLLTLGSGHTHTVSLSNRDVQAIAEGGAVTELSSVDAGHSHEVSFN